MKVQIRNREEVKIETWREKVERHAKRESGVEHGERNRYSNWKKLREKVE